MTAQNLDVYETFQVQGISLRKFFIINELLIDSSGFPAPPKVGQSNEYVHYAIDPHRKSPFACRQSPTIRPVISSGVLCRTDSTSLAGLQ
jgi:hypothetical protein